MGEGPLTDLASSPLKALALGSPYTLSIQVHGPLQRGLLVGPFGAMPATPLGDIRSQVECVAQLQRAGRVIPLVGGYFLDRLGTSGLLQVLLGIHHAVDQRVRIGMVARVKRGAPTKSLSRSTTCSAL